MSNAEIAGMDEFAAAGTADPAAGTAGLAAVETADFAAVITPHRSLSRAGLRRLVGFIVLVSGGLSTGLWMIGAWPVVGFNGVEIGLAIYLMRRNARPRTLEEVVLYPSSLVVRRTDAAGRVFERRLGTGWTQAVVEERPGRTPALLLVERGRRVEVGAELGEAEKRDLAVALREALVRLRNPRFDNPQLR